MAIKKKREYRTVRIDRQTHEIIRKIAYKQRTTLLNIIREAFVKP